MEGKSVLVTDSPKIIQAEPGQYAVLQTMLLNMFGPEQLPYFEAWITTAYHEAANVQVFIDAENGSMLGGSL